MASKDKLFTCGSVGYSKEEYQNRIKLNINTGTSGCNSTQSAKSASAACSSAFRGRNLTATLTLPETAQVTYMNQI